MSKIAIATDSNSGISQAKAEKSGVFVLPMSFNIDGTDYHEGVSISHNEFFDAQMNGSKIFTSQPAPGEVMDFWDKILEDYDQIIYIPMAAGLSSSYSTAVMLSGDYDDKVTVIDNGRVSVSQKQAVLDAKMLADAGKSAIEIRNELAYQRSNASIYICVDDMKYLKAGGRVSGATAAIASVLNIKPVLSVNEGVIETYSKARGTKAGKKAIFEALERDMARFGSTNIEDFHLHTAAALRRDEAIAWNEEVEAHFGAKSHISTIPLSVCAHVGIGTFGACVSKRITL